NDLPNLIAKMNAAKWGTSEGLFVEDGFITEGASSNLFIVSKGVLRTPPADSGILPGVMRETIIELAEREGVPWRESPISVDELKHSEEGFITNSVLEIVPVVSVEGYFVGDGKGGPVTRLLQKAYKNLVVTTGPTSR
ncbi:MAG: aminotransferase class IV, partial [Thermodesulfobacteriota bacterium]